MRARWPRGLVALLLAASAGALGAAALLAPAAHAAPDGTCGLNPCPPTVSTVTGPAAEDKPTITITWTPSTANSVVSDPTTAPTIQWQVPSLPVPGGFQPPLAAEPLTDQSCGQQSGNLVCTYQLPTNMVDNGYVLNGIYTVVPPTTKACFLVLCSGPSTSTSTPLPVANPPTAPMGVTATVVPNSKPPTVKISWTANPEPDLVGYQVFSGTTAVCQELATATAPPPTSCSTMPTDGKYSYHVVAYRYGATYSAAAASEQTSDSGTTPTVTITGAGTSTSTTVPGNGQTLGTGTPGSGVSAKPTSGRTGGSRSINGTPAAISAASSATTASTSGGGFNPTLPYGALPQAPTTLDPAAISVPAAPHKGTSVATIALVGAGLLVAVIAVHGLWLRSEVRRAGSLEPLEPET